MTHIYKNKNAITLFTCFCLFLIVSLFYFNKADAEIIQNETISNIENIDEEVLPKKIVADLVNMKIYTYENGQITKEMNIVSKGKPESYYATPVGDYKVILKEKIHFSSIGHVYMPYSMQFFGNFFIHGIPYYPSGEKVTSAYSGGCIRLEDVDAEYIYNFSEKDTPLIIKNKDTILTEINIDDAKFVKSMNALIALENVSMTDNNLNLVRNMLKENSDDNAVYLASRIGTSFFLDQMNKKAMAIGLDDTNFTDIKSLVNTTQKDKQKFVEYLYNNKSYLYDLTIN